MTKTGNKSDCIVIFIDYLKFIRFCSSIDKSIVNSFIFFSQNQMIDLFTKFNCLLFYDKFLFQFHNSQILRFSVSQFLKF